MKMMKTCDYGLVSLVKSSKYVGGIRNSKHFGDESTFCASKTTMEIT